MPCLCLKEFPVKIRYIFHRIAAFTGIDNIIGLDKNLIMVKINQKLRIPATFY